MAILPTVIYLRSTGLLKAVFIGISTILQSESLVQYESALFTVRNRLLEGSFSTGKVGDVPARF